MLKIENAIIVGRFYELFSRKLQTWLCLSESAKYMYYENTDRVETLLVFRNVVDQLLSLKKIICDHWFLMDETAQT